MNQRVKILYTNWKGIKRERIIEPIEIWFGSTEYHKEDQWLLKALDCEDDFKTKDFASKNIENWTPLQ